MKKNFQSLNIINLLTSFSIALLIAYTVHSMFLSERKLRLGLEQKSVIDEMLSLRAEIESTFTHTQLIPFTFRSHLRQQGPLTHSEFAEVASELISRNPFVKSISRVQNDAVTHLYPQAYSIQELGYIYQKGDVGSKLYFDAENKQQTIISTPDNTNTPNQLLDLYTPFYVNKKYLGQIHIILDWNYLLNSPIFHSLSNNFIIEFYSQENPAASSLQSEQKNNSLFLNMNIAQTTWEMKITPKTSWSNSKPATYHLAAVVIVFLIVFIGIFYWLRQNQALRIERNTALKAIKEKNRFLSYAAHDLRQPLSALSFSIEELVTRQKSLLDSRLTKNMISSIRNLNELFDQLLDIEQINNRKKIISNKLVSLVDIFKELKSELEPIFTEHSIELLIYCKEIYIETDPVLLKRILRNLIINGLESTQQGYVAIICNIETIEHDSEEKQIVKIRIQDTGQGIEKSHQKYIFDAFQQHSIKQHHISSGIGAGLNIVKNYCDLLNFTIDLSSSKDIGSEFTLSVGSPIKYTAATHSKSDTQAATMSSPLYHIKAVAYGLDITTLKLIESWGMDIQNIEKLSEEDVLDKTGITLLLINAREATQVSKLQGPRPMQHYLSCMPAAFIGKNDDLEHCKSLFLTPKTALYLNENILPVRLRAQLIQIIENLKN